MSIRNGPNGEFQLTPKPTERRGLGELPRKTSRNGADREPGEGLAVGGVAAGRGAA